MRAISTVLDVAVFLLLVSAAVGTLVLVDAPQEAESSADESVEIVASSTLSVEYDIRGETRHAHGTVGALLGRAAVANATLDGTRVVRSGGTFRAAVANATRKRLPAPNRTRIHVRWRPYRGATVRGSVAVGPESPSGVDVHSATVSVPVPVPDSHGRASDRAGGGYDAVAEPVARAVAAGLLPDDRVDASVFRESPTAVASSRRFRAFADETDVAVAGPLSAGKIGQAHQRVVAGLTDMLGADLNGQFESPKAAAETVRTGRAHITVRRWDA
jgi:hypothetical protein